MKKKIILLALVASFSSVLAQSEDKDLQTWYHKSFSETKVYGVNTEGAYRFLESKNLKPKTLIVGVLDSGVEVDHPGLKNNIWVNAKEIPNNGIDDDKNGYVDDIHGWNFIGGAKEDIDVDNMEVTRVVAKYKPLFEGENSAQNKKNQEKMKKEFEMYMKSKEIFNKKGPENIQNFMFFSKIQELIPTMKKMLGGKNLTPQNLQKIKPTTADEALSLDFLSRITNDPELNGKSSQQVEESLVKMCKEALNHYGPGKKQYDLTFDPRKEIVGDDYENYSEKYYGNNHYEGPDAQHGTHVAGIIAGYPQGKEIQYGVASKVAKILSVRTVPNGDERDKDVANAIYYAVDNGAKILNMSFGKPVSPGKDKVWEAIKYAEKKGVLLVKAAGNENENIEENEYFPTNFKAQSDKNPFVKNMLVVGASTNDNENLKASFSNYNGKMVDVFAPGDKIYSLVPDGKYEFLQGTSMAAPVVSGIAAILWAYMPKLKPEQIIEAIVKTANHSTTSTGLPAPNAIFSSLSRSRGVADAEKAARYAYEKFYKK